MSEPFLGQIMMAGFDFPPEGYAFCDGEILPVNQNQALYALLGNTYGGSKGSTFALPDMRGRAPVFWGDDFKYGQKGGSETVTLTYTQMPNHYHEVKGTTALGDARRAGKDKNRGFATTNHLDDPEPDLIYGVPQNLTNMNPEITKEAGGGQPHSNLQPYLPIAFCIAIQGQFPARK